MRGIRSIQDWVCLLLLLVGAILAPLTTAARNSLPRDQSSPSEKSETKDQKSNATVKLRIEVTSNTDKPISNASVYVRFEQSGGVFHKDKLAELSLKTNQDGSVKVPEIPQGKILIQVIATGWHTYGKWYDINKDEELVQIKLDPPPHWY